MQAFQKINQILFITATTVLLAVPTGAQTSLFTDNFNSGASPLWNNLRGNWIATNGVYYSQSPGNQPLTHSAVPFELTDCTVDVDISSVADGGIWLHADNAGQNGILLVTGGNLWGSGVRGGNAGRSLYWHQVINGNYSAVLNQAFNVFSNPGTENTHIQVKVMGNQYAVYVNGSNNAATTLVNSTYTSGRVALYDYSQQTFDNFVITVPTQTLGPFRLGITNAGLQKAMLYWSTNANGYFLESASSIPGTNWSALTNSPSVVGTNFTVTISITNTQQFFRLGSQ